LKSADQAFGLLANGISGQWEISIDETTKGEDRWFAQIEGPTIYFSFEIPSVDIVKEMFKFLKPQPATIPYSLVDSEESKCSLLLSKDKKIPVNLVKDDEYPDRFFVVVGKMDNHIVRFVLAGKDIEEIADALRQVEEDLKDGD
jgi:hypothetical protein